MGGLLANSLILSWLFASIALHGEVTGREPSLTVLYGELALTLSLAALAVWNLAHPPGPPRE